MLSRQVILRASRAAAPQRAIASQVRFYAAAPAAAANENVKPPVTLFGIDGTYATALYTAAVKTQSLEPTARGLSQLEQLVKKDPKLATILGAPTLTASDKSAIVAELEKSSGSSSAAVKNLLEVLAENNRLGLLPEVCSKFGELMSAARGEVEMTVTSAQPLDNRTLSRLETAVAKSSYVGAGKKLKVTNQVNPDIVGGLVVEVGDRTIDLSVSSKLAKMNKLLTDAL
ncbi:ATP synthase F0 subcomplex subunit OSCP atp5 [Pyricularia oryzae]|uniref:ATP synthase subunit 5, mitochondrial n=5 Tax=Pyricularia TaxID=48558 RepID=A0ABQ8NJY2_PYRGI|nr:ATP synthase subunit 5 [Pyricularia oryzae 70-15]ELQ43402.1 ATP synthase subunit 5 [Pyricularia oryzae Y34]KAH8843738.1 ATP synthase F0 subcomplex subunit OSCP atp5 [Pyricularia oryzae]KAI6298287.1 ATP synthase F0 subcomplex subunit OSCP atp5 [Pyricularia grisea]EHA50523.1 ATP synthase subunit 5 [Pyricularia oryzae 70-15]KAH9431213.1 ATP synthase F0 subcomplex subunit OSCP atp5 [Pyricularia oryzae]